MQGSVNGGWNHRSSPPDVGLGTRSRRRLGWCDRHSPDVGLGTRPRRRLAGVMVMLGRRSTAPVVPLVSVAMKLHHTGLADRHWLQPHTEREQGYLSCFVPYRPIATESPAVLPPRHPIFGFFSRASGADGASLSLWRPIFFPSLCLLSLTPSTPPSPPIVLASPHILEPRTTLRIEWGKVSCM